MDTKTITGKEGRTHNSGLAKVAVQCSADTFVVNQSLVLRINICGKNRHLRQAAKRYMLCLDKHTAEKPTQKFILFFLPDLFFANAH